MDETLVDSQGSLITGTSQEHNDTMEDDSLPNGNLLEAGVLFGTRRARPPWSPEEDITLVQHVAKHGTRNWGSLQAKGLLPTRDQKACCNRFILLKRRVAKEGLPVSLPQLLPVLQAASKAASVTSSEGWNLREPSSTQELLHLQSVQKRQALQQGANTNVAKVSDLRHTESPSSDRREFSSSSLSTLLSRTRDTPMEDLSSMQQSCSGQPLIPNSNLTHYTSNLAASNGSWLHQAGAGANLPGIADPRSANLRLTSGASSPLSRMHLKNTSVEGHVKQLHHFQQLQGQHPSNFSSSFSPSPRSPWCWPPSPANSSPSMSFSPNAGGAFKSMGNRPGLQGSSQTNQPFVSFGSSGSSSSVGSSNPSTTSTQYRSSSLASLGPIAESSPSLLREPDTSPAWVKQRWGGAEMTVAPGQGLDGPFHPTSTVDISLLLGGNSSLSAETPQSSFSSHLSEASWNPPSPAAAFNPTSVAADSGFPASYFPDMSTTEHTLPLYRSTSAPAITRGGPLDDSCSDALQMAFSQPSLHAMEPKGSAGMQLDGHNGNQVQRSILGRDQWPDHLLNELCGGGPSMELDLDFAGDLAAQLAAEQGETNENPDLLVEWTDDQSKNMELDCSIDRFWKQYRPTTTSTSMATANRATAAPPSATWSAVPTTNVPSPPCSVFLNSSTGLFRDI